MSEQNTVSINTGDEAAKGPTIEEQYQELVKEGLIAPEGDVPGDDKAKATKEGSNEDRPEWLPEKFKTVEDFLKSHEELERKLGSGGKKEEKAEVANAATPTPEETKAAKEATTKAGLDLASVSKEYIDGGSLSEDTYSKLEAAGYPKEMVDIYIEGLTGRLNATQNAAFEITGGEEAYGTMIDWAIQNLSDEEQEAFDRAVNSNSKATALMAIKGLKATMDAAVKAGASEEPVEQINKGGAVASNVYETIDDYMADLNDPQYDTNETFRRKVMAKLDRSSIM